MSQVHIHPQFNPSMLDNDFSLLELESEIEELLQDSTYENNSDNDIEQDEEFVAPFSVTEYVGKTDSMTNISDMSDKRDTTSQLLGESINTHCVSGIYTENSDMNSDVKKLLTLSTKAYFR